MGKLLITEEEKLDILNKYQDNTDDKVFTYLRRNYPIYEIENFFDNSKKIKYIVVNDKMKFLSGNKNYLKSLLQNELTETFPDVPTPVLVRTIKKFLSLILVDQ